VTDVPVRDAATVVLLRDGSDGAGIEAWLLTRVTQMAFAAGMTVFPGGRVDDADSALPLVGGDFARLAARFGCSEDVARALVGAAARETFEETGVLLTVPSADLSGARSDVELGRVSFGELLRANGLSVDAPASSSARCRKRRSRRTSPASRVRRPGCRSTRRSSRRSAASGSSCRRR
jgi:8-oxo-dGTP pyrophosphatase MutT (NUDIX family)